MLSFQALLAILLVARHVEGSCYGRCWEDYNSANSCHCNSRCGEFNNCCSDFNSMCPNWGNSCANGRCGELMNTAYSCQCNTQCTQYGDCCADYGTECLGEGGNVVEPVSPGTGGASCATSTSSSATSTELSCLAQLLWDGDVNRASSSQYTLNRQGQIAQSALSQHQDLASADLFSYLDEAGLFTRQTYAAYLALVDNYVPSTGTSEVVTSSENAEIDAFMAAIQGTDVITKLHEFLAYKGLASSNLATFMADLREMWFGLYSRSSGAAMDSSGFEHVFLGEFKNGKVSGFHNWLTTYLLEKDGDLNYYGYIWDKQPGILAVQVRWGSLYKDLGSMFYGASPEFDLAMYTMCYITSPDSLCRFNMAGASVAIQTWSWNNSSYGGGKKYLASAYPA
ncbi:PREDICTED: poly(U)-specific endoribonuclease-D-like [Branchiostoma belcheri]|uniref:Uridylate-specific endoribonuclease n=1 Tax=Branchiostoma belcheri TaxID=7741 RepID=A0A6P4Y5I1_BRABE|nr:PREDICTED: poly(U)-specific endoribonuclease-D-like [Branchiostoma belcheri]